MTLKKRIMLLVFSLLLFVTFSFAWINDLQNPTGRYMTFSFGEKKAFITSNELEVKLYRDMTGNNDFEDMTESIDPDVASPLFEFSDFAPGVQQKFRADIINTSDTPLALRVVLSNIICDNVEMRKHLEIGTSGYEGFPSSIITPKLEEKTLADGLSEGSFTLIESAEIPSGGQKISIYFYVTFSRAATEALSGQEFTIGSINFMAI